MDKVFKIIILIELILFLIFIIGYFVYEKNYYEENPLLNSCDTQVEVIFDNFSYFPNLSNSFDKEQHLNS